MTKTINIVKSGCLYTHKDGTRELFEPGEHELDDDVADHWFILAHSDHPQPYDAPPGTPEYVTNISKRMARKKLIDAALEERTEEQKTEPPQE